MMKLFLLLGAALAMLSVILGAFAAHGLKQKLPENLLSAFSTGVEYQFFHALALILIVILAKLFPHHLWTWSASLMLAGIVCFSGSLYALSLSGIKWFGPITPLGGLLFIAGWAVMLAAINKGYQ
ncbi:DUF423 domain-containing protein [Planctobacterium marinum]|uniref:DUF423 domain-containing protein n=1 Tax=Planctobacterium marinum TaxID=1631968 RepID=UPI001E31A1B2|nr:DUF423 domain-containing protein [Planctobacterium marinum]MCC2603904.1 DUF423 domain-containing protein [Planctobacterium marinum]